MFLVSDGRDRIGADGGKVNRIVAFFVDLANEDAGIIVSTRVEGHVREKKSSITHIISPLTR